VCVLFSSLDSSAPSAGRALFILAGSGHVESEVAVNAPEGEG